MLADSLGRVGRPPNPIHLAEHDAATSKVGATGSGVWAATGQARRAKAKWATDADPIFPSSVGTPLDARNWRKNVWRPAVKAAGVEATPHTLRHSLASLLFEQGHTAAQVAAWLGHEDPSFTLRTYIHARDVGDATFLDDVLGGQA